MKVTVCQLHDESDLFMRDWEALTAHVSNERSELVVLPQMPFCPSFLERHHFDFAIWQAALAAHDAGEKRLHQLAPTMVVSSRPMDFGNERYHECFLWDEVNGVRTLHGESVANEHEVPWFLAATPDFVPTEVATVLLGVLFCSEFDRTAELERYAHEGVALLVTPRSVVTGESENCRENARRIALASGAYQLSSNRVSDDGRFDGGGWIIDPAGRVLCQTDAQQPFATLEVNAWLGHRVKRSSGHDLRGVIDTPRGHR